MLAHGGWEGTVVLPPVHMKTDFSLQRYENTESQKITLTVAKSHSFPLVLIFT